MSSLEELISGIVGSLSQTKSSVESAHTKYIDDAQLLLPDTIKQISKNTEVSLEGMSLLSLKSSSLLSYVNNLVLVILSHLERLRDDKTDIEALKLEAVMATVKQRVTLEKGIKPLEKKLSYQLDKMVRSFHRMEEESVKASQKIAEEAEHQQSSKRSARNASGSDSDSDEDSDEEDALSYRPDAAALAKLAPSNKSGKPIKESSTEKYKPPKISAVAPPTAAFDDRAAPKQNNRKLQSMEEYLAETSDLPQAESSIGATIVGHGRGGVKTSRDKQKEMEVQRYEESNFTRLPNTATKKSFRQKMAERANTFAGEDWSMFGNKRDLKEGTSRKRASGTAWDRVKRSRS
ncbi:hypothetical protein METBIDRAFT_35197 [Metschnikowia bicuspidata var. bicuspidata NRRL YB-4993]|uniref:Uncharacterized protein n=1 Tax=Metschnikowia bicuspidata var. bicuspidata NRRL YB-4993 TaxID=869754 RepID=A0A1A0HFS8_9ASCO|nr:hypothetical protein METBIDRAFT_35197 [Metschnikowia bicuspidata var. bicuspidata NRRL YB-4993]OBA22856.1 hypothetical protein METBIDRAFT_35197 [Metschnikowia bicuspidata var. bicuspidata NRRL YB-4993]